MNMKRILAGAVAAVMTLGTAYIAPLADVGDDAVTVVASEDAWLRNDSSNGGKNFNNQKGYEIRHGAAGENQHLGCLKFELQTVNANDIKSATLELVTETRDGDIELRALPFYDGWSEGNITYTDASSEITNALAADSIGDEFKAAWGGQKLFDATAGSSLSSWTTKVNVTSYVTKQLADNDTTVSILLAPGKSVTATNGVTFLSKAASRDTYGNNATRWDSIISTFSSELNDGSNLEPLKPRLVIEYYAAGEQPEPTSIDIKGDTQINSFTGESEHTYTAEVKDQSGNTMPDEAVTWSVTSDAESTGVTINPDTGVMSVPANEPPQKVTVKAECGTVTGTLDVNIICEDTSLKSELVNGVRMRGSGNNLYDLYPNLGTELGMPAHGVAILRFNISNIADRKDYLSKITLNLQKDSTRNNTAKLGAWLYDAPENSADWKNVDWTSSANANDVKDNISLVLGTEDFRTTGITGSNMTNPLAAADINSDNMFLLEFTGDNLKKLTDYADKNGGLVDIVVTRGNIAATTGRTDVVLNEAYLSMSYSEPDSIKIFQGSHEIESGESIELAGLHLPQTFKYSAEVYNTEGGKMSLTPQWSFKTTAASNKVKFNTDTGEMTIPAGASDQTLTLTAMFGDIEKKITIQIVQELVPNELEIKGADNINNYISTNERTFTYTASVKDQFGNEMDGQAIVWSYETTAEENAVTFSNGVLTVPVNVADQTVTITAQCGDISAEKTVTVSKTILNLPETYKASRSMKLRGLGNTSEMVYDTEQEEIGIFAGAPGIFRFDISDIINNGAENVVTGISFTLYRQTTSGSLNYGVWEYADPNDSARTDGKQWIDGDWTEQELTKADMLNNCSLIFGMDDMSSQTASYAEGRDDYIAPIASSAIDSEGKCTFTITGDALTNIMNSAKDTGYIDLVVTSADLDERDVSTKPHFYMTGAEDQYKPVIDVTYNLPSTPRRVEISGEDTLYINSRVPAYSAQYSAKVYDQDGNLYENQDVEWSADLGETTDVEFDAETGTIRVKNTSGEGTVTITAKSAYAVGTKVVTVKKIPDGLTNGTFESVDDSYLAEGWTPNVPVYKVNFDETDYFSDKWTDAKTNDAGTLFTRTQRYELKDTEDETTDIRGTSGINSVVKMQYSTTLSDEEAAELMNSANQTIGVNNAINGAFMTVGYEIPYYYMLDYYLSSGSEQVLSNQGIYVGLEFRNTADTGYLASVATGNQYVNFTKGQWRTYTGTFTSGTANQINGQMRVNIGMSGMRGTGYIDYFRLVPKGIDTQTAYEGSNSMYVPNTLTWTSDAFSVEGGSYYTYIASVKPETDIAEGQVTYTFMDNNYNTVGEYVVKTDAGDWSEYDENGWKTVRGETVVPSGATNCRITVSNPDGEGGVWFDNLVFTKTEDAKADTIRITGGNNEVVIPETGENMYQYTAVVYDQYNNVISSDVEWTVTDAAGISITSNGVLKVSSTASEGKVTITVSKDGKTASMLVSVIKQGETKEPESEGEYGFNGSFTENDGVTPYGWTNTGKDVIAYSFDTGLDGWKSSRTDYGALVDGQLEWSDSENHTDTSSSGSLLLYNPSYNMPIGTVPNDVKIQGGMPYEFQMYFKEKGVSDDSTVRAHLRYFNSSGGTIAETPNMLRYYPNEYSANVDGNGWQRWYGTEVAPTNASTVRVDVRFRGGLNNSDGYAYFDDIKVSKVSRLDKDNAYNGNPSLMLVGYNEDATTAGKEYGERWVSDKLTNISQGSSYSYGAMLQTYNASSGAYLSFIFYDEDGNEIKTEKSEKISGTTNLWQYLSGSVTAPATAVSVAVAYNLDGTGTAWISDITFNAMTDKNISGIRIDGASTVKIPSSGNKTESYTVTAVNASGDSVSAVDAAVTASGLPSGVEFKNGVLTVAQNASAGTVNLSASYNGYSASKSVSITKSDSSSSDTGSTGSGGGGGGGGTVNNTLKPTNTAKPENSPMGNVDYGQAVSSDGSTGTNSGSTEIPSLLQPPELNYFTGGNDGVIFSDIDDVPWAKDAIESLYRAGVVSGKGDKIFAPNDKVTRAEFVTMLMKTFRVESDNKDNSFTDVNEGDWYYDYVNAAVGTGVVSGISDDYFGASQNITRQDIAVMGTRLWDSMGKEMNGRNRVAFDDLDKISDYALDSVSAMASAGIVSGTDTGEFLPLDDATRAQAAVIIYKMAVKYDE